MYFVLPQITFDYIRNLYNTVEVLLDWGDSLAVKRPSFSSRGLMFDSRYQHGSSQSCVTVASGGLIHSSGFGHFMN